MTRREKLELMLMIAFAAIMIAGFVVIALENGA